MRAPVFVAWLAVAAVASPTAAGDPAAAAQGQRGAEQTERIARTIRLGQNGRVEVSNLAGDIVITGVDGDEVSIEALKRTRGGRADLAAVTVNIEERPGRVAVETVYPSRRGRNSNGVSVQYTISVPASASVDLRSVSGSVRVTGVRGVVRGQTMSGDVVTSKSPRIETAQSVSGAIDLSDTDVDGALEASTMSGDIRARGLKARRLTFSTVSGNIDVSDVSSERVEMKSMSGDVAFGGSLARNGRYMISSHSGDVQLAVGMGVGFELNATSFSGDVRSDIPVTLGRDSQEPPRRGRGRSNRSMRAVFGDGSAMLEVSTFSGDISIMRR